MLTISPGAIRLDSDAPSRVAARATSWVQT
jgi:hypothetical protein